MSDARSAIERDIGTGAKIASDRLEELAQHFDVTDAGDLPWDEATDVTVKRPELAQVSLRLPKEDLAQLKAQAARMSVGYTTLIRMMIRRHLREVREAGK